MKYYIRIDYLNRWDPLGAVRQFIEVGSDGFASRAVEEYENGEYGWATRFKNSMTILPDYNFPSEEDFSEKNSSSEGEYKTQKIKEEAFEKMFLEATRPKQ